MAKQQVVAKRKTTDAVVILKGRYQWYINLIKDLEHLAYEGIVKTKHAMGVRILRDELKFDKPQYGSKQIVGIAKDLGCGKTDIYSCVQFARKYPEISDVSENLSWYHITHKLLPNNPHVSQNTGESEWYTPQLYIDAARLVMGSIDVDPATTKEVNKRIKAKKFYTKEKSGLEKRWTGTVWMNPPYAQPIIREFCETFLSKYKNAEITQGCVLTNNATETAIGQAMLNACSAVCFPNGRISYWDGSGQPKNTPLQGQMILYFGKWNAKFYEVFSEFGVCLTINYTTRTEPDS